MFTKLSEIVQEILSRGGVEQTIAMITTIVVLSFFMFFLIYKLASFTPSRSVNITTNTKVKSKKSEKVEVTKGQYIWFGIVLPIIMIVSGVLSWII